MEKLNTTFKSATSGVLVPAHTVQSGIKFLVVLCVLLFAMVIGLYAAYRAEQSAKLQAIAIASEVVEKNVMLATENVKLAKAIYVSEKKLDAALIPEANFKEAFENHVSKPVTETVQTSATYAKAQALKAYAYVKE